MNKAEQAEIVGSLAIKVTELSKAVACWKSKIYWISKRLASLSEVIEEDGPYREFLDARERFMEEDGSDLSHYLDLYAEAKKDLEAAQSQLKQVV